MTLRTSETLETVQRRRPGAQGYRGGYTHDRQLASALCPLFPDLERAYIADQQITNQALVGANPAEAAVARREQLMIRERPM